MISAGTHPDVVTLGPGDALCKPRAGESSHERHPLSRDIRICQLRGLIDLVARYPFEGKYRLIIIDPAERLGRDAAHTLLKTLEEPPGHTIFALLSAAPDAIIETILSRCRRFDVRPVPKTEIEAGLRARGIDEDVAAAASEAARGRPGRALAFAENPGLMGDRERLLTRCAELAAAGLGERFRYAEGLAERWRADREQTAAELSAWEAFWEAQLREAAGEGDEARNALRALRAVLQAREDLQTNVTPRALFELMLLSFPRLTLEGTAKEASAPHV
jgi:DNA polymerase-3 subunit delta'